MLIHALDQELTGGLVLIDPVGAMHALELVDGAITCVHTAAAVPTVAAFLIREQLPSSKAAPRGLDETGVQFLEQSTEPLWGDIVRAATERLTIKLGRLCLLPVETRYRFYYGRRLDVSLGDRADFIARLDPLAAIMSAVRQLASSPFVECTLARLGARRFCLHELAPVERLGLRLEWRVVEALRDRRWTLGELLDVGIATAAIVNTTVYGLLLTRNLELGTSARPPVGLTSDERAPLRRSAERGVAARLPAGAAAAEVPESPTRLIEPRIAWRR